MVYRCLGSFRFLLALLVVIHHFGVTLTDGALRVFIGSWLPGNAAVLTFYAISGLVITEAALAIYSARPGAFILNRFVRVLIPYWIALTLFLLVAIVGSPMTHSGKPLPDSALDVPNLLANYFLIWPKNLAPFVWLTNYLTHDFLLVFWSIRYEIVFYLAVLAAILLAGGDRTRLKSILIAGVAATLVATVYFRIGVTGRWGGFQTISWPFFCAGILAYFAIRDKELYVVLLAVVAAGIGVAGYGYMVPNATPTRVALQLGTLFVLLSTAYTLANVTSFSFVRLDQILGDLSYSLYLTHMIVLLAALKLEVSIGMGTAIIATLVSVAVSVLFNYAVEPTVSKIRNTIRGRTLREVTAPDPNYSAGISSTT